MATVLSDFNGGVVTTSLINNLIKAIKELQGLKARKTADESLSTSTTLQNDDELLVAVAANTTYDLVAKIYIHGNSTGDVKFALTFPTNTTVSGWGGLSIVTGSVGASTSADVEAHAFTAQTSSPTSSLAFGVPDTNGTVAILTATVEVGNTAGTVQLQWAQNTSSGSTTINAGSRMTLIQD